MLKGMGWRWMVVAVSALAVSGCGFYFGDEPEDYPDAGYTCYWCYPDAGLGPDGYVPVCRDAAPAADAHVIVDAGAGCSDAQASAPYKPVSSPAPTTGVRSPDSIAHHSGCNMLINAGCGPGEKCGRLVIEAGSPPLAQVGCAPAGDKQPGEPCSYNGQFACAAESGGSDCVGGSECIGGMCMKLCDTENGWGCMSGTCTTATKLSTIDTDVGICTNACEPPGTASK